MGFLALNSWLLGAIVVFSAAVTQTLTGFGFGLVSVPLLLLIFPSHQAITLSMMLSLSCLILSGIKERKMAQWHIIWRAILIGFPALIGGIVLGSKLNAIYLKALIGICLIIYVSIQWIYSEKQRMKKAQDSMVNYDAVETIANGDEKCVFIGYPKGFTVASFASGLLTGVAGIPGPPIVSVLVNFLNKDRFHATVVNYFIFQYSLAVASRFLIQPAIFNTDLFLFAFSLLLPTFLGYFVGTPIRKYINEVNFKRLAFLLLMIVGFTSVWEPVKTFIFSAAFSKLSIYLMM